MKVLSRAPGDQDFQLLVNRVESEEQAREVHQTLCRAAEHFLELRTGYAGFISTDRNLPKAVTCQKPLLELNPDSPACFDIQNLARRLLAACLRTSGRGETSGQAGLQGYHYGVG